MGKDIVKDIVNVRGGRQTVYNLGDLPPRLGNCVEALSSAPARAGCGYMNSKEIRAVLEGMQKGETRDYKSNECARHTMAFFENNGVLLCERGLTGKNCYWFDGARAEAVLAWLGSQTSREPLAQAIEPSVRLLELKQAWENEAASRKAGQDDKKPGDEVPTGDGPTGEDEEEVASKPSGKLAADPRLFRWRLYLTLEEGIVWDGLVSGKGVNQDDSAAMAFYGRCVEKKLLWDDGEGIHWCVDLREFEVVLIDERPRMSVCLLLMNFIEHIVSRHQDRGWTAESLGDQQARPGNTLTQWLELNATQDDDDAVEPNSVIRVVRGYNPEHQPTHAIGIIVYRQDFQDNLVCWPGFWSREIEVRADQRSLAKMIITTDAKKPKATVSRKPVGTKVDDVKKEEKKKDDVPVKNLREQIADLQRQIAESDELIVLAVAECGSLDGQLKAAREEVDRLETVWSMRREDLRLLDEQKTEYYAALEAAKIALELENREKLAAYAAMLKLQMEEKLAAQVAEKERELGLRE